MTTDERLATLETTIDHLREDMGELRDHSRDIFEKLSETNRSIAILVSQRDGAEKNLSRWKSAGLTVASGLAVALIVWLGHIAMVVQAAKVQP